MVLPTCCLEQLARKDCDGAVGAGRCGVVCAQRGGQVKRRGGMHAPCGFSCTPDQPPIHSWTKQSRRPDAARASGTSSFCTVGISPPVRPHAVVPHHCQVFVGPTSQLRRVLRHNPQKEATVPPLSLGAIVKQESTTPPLCYLTQSSKSRSSSSKRTVPTEVDPKEAKDHVIRRFDHAVQSELCVLSMWGVARSSSVKGKGSRGPRVKDPGRGGAQRIYTPPPFAQILQVCRALWFRIMKT